MILTVVVASCLPLASQLAGADLSRPIGPHGSLVQAALEWGTPLAALMLATLALRLAAEGQTRACTLLAMAWLSIALTDPFHALVGEGLLRPPGSLADALSLSGTLGRGLAALALGVGARVLCRPGRRSVSPWGGATASGACGVLALLMGLTLVRLPTLPEATLPGALVSRPYDAAVLLMLAGALPGLLRLRRVEPGVLSEALLWSLLPAALGQAHMTFGSVRHDDAQALVAHGLTLVSTLVPLAAFGRAAAAGLRDSPAGLRGVRGDMPAEDSERNAFFDLSNELLCIADFEGRFRHLNGTWEHVLGYTPDELLRRPFLDFVHPDDREATLMEAGRLAAGDETLSFENRYVAKDGGIRHFLWMARSEMRTRRIYAVARDITSLREAQAALVASKEQAEAASRAKSEFLATMSHELRTPLNSVIGFAGVLMRQGAGRLSDEERLFLERIHDNGQHLLALINSVLDVAKIEAGRLDVQRSRTDVPQLVRETLEQLEGQLAGRDLVLEAEIPERVAPLETDPGMLKQILINLVGNAIKFTPRGRIVVRLQCDHSEGRPQSIEVADTGIGIPADRVEHIFLAFEQAQTGPARPYGGSGLGLTIARSLARRLGYDLDVSSVEGQGSTFRLAIGGPTAARAATAAARADPSRPDGSPSTAAGRLGRPG